MKKIIILFLLITTPVWADAPTRTNTFVSGTTIRADEVNTDFDDLFGYLSTGVDNIRSGGLNAITEINSSIKTGSDSKLVTGTAGSSGTLGYWDANGDFVGMTDVSFDTTNETITSTTLLKAATLYLTSAFGVNGVDCAEGEILKISSGVVACSADAGASGGDSITINGSAVTDPDFVSTAQISFVNTSDSITALIVDDRVVEADFDVIDGDTPGDEECLTYESGDGSGNFEWQACSSGSGDNISINGSAATDPDFVSTGHIAFVSTSDTVIANIRTNEIDATMFADGDWGDMSVSSNSVTLDSDTVDTAEIAANAVGESELDESMNFTATGAWNFGGATDLEIPNGTSPTVDTAGQAAIDTSNDELIYFGASKRVLTYVMQKGFFDSSPTASDNIMFFKAPFNLTITDIDCIVDQSQGSNSVDIDLQECDSTGKNCTAVDSTITCDTDGAADDGSLTNGTIDSGDWVNVAEGTVTGTIITGLNITIQFTKDGT